MQKDVHDSENPRPIVPEVWIELPSHMTTNLTDDPLDSPLRRPAFGWTSSLRFLIGASIYCYGILHFARIHVAAEALVSVVFVALALPWFRLEGEWISRIRLMVIESLFNMIALLAKVFLLLGIATDSRLLDYLFAGFFVLQILGFVVAQVRKRKLSIMPATAAMAVGLTMWFLSGSGVRLTPEGALQFWGGDAPVYLRWMYVFWVLGVLLVEYGSLLPKATILLTHLASVAVAFNSGEFFHARILTASHFFIINFVFLYEKKGFGGQTYAWMPWLASLTARGDDDRWKPALVTWLVNIACVGTLALWILRG